MAPPRKYVRLEDFKKFVSNDFAHVAREVRWHTWLLLVIAASVIARLVELF